MDLELRVQCNTCVDGKITKVREVPPGSGNKVETVTDCDQDGCDGTTVPFRKFNRLKLPTGVFWSVEVYEAIVGSEYVELVDAQKERIKLLLSAGMTDLTEDSKAKGILWQIFDENSTTRANLITLIG